MNTNPAERNKMIELSLRQLLDSFPIAGPILNNILFEYRSQVRQDRLNHFVSMLEAEFSKLTIDPKTMQTEDNLDLFESIIKKATETKSEKKRRGLKNILLNGIKQQADISYCELFAEQLMSIHQKELEILAFHQYYLIDGKGPLARRNELKAEAAELNRMLQAGCANDKNQRPDVYSKTQNSGCHSA